MDATDRRQRAAQEAAEWWVTLQGDPARDERERFVDWLRESAIHVAEMLRIAQVHGALAQFERWSQLPTGSGLEQVSEPENVIPLRPADSHTQLPQRQGSGASRQPLRLRSSPTRWAIAASLLIFAVATSWLLIQPRGQTIETQRGERREVALSDGSVVQVDPGTLLKVNFESHARRVVLERGRALFHVAKNAERPFFVQADGTVVRAVGTAFAVERATEAVVVTVAEGRVAVVPRSAPAVKQDPPTREVAGSRAASAGSAVTEIVLSANEQLTVESSGSAETVRSVDSRRTLAWAEGRLIFENQSVEEAVRQLNRYNRVQIVVTDPTLARRTISGVFNATDPQSFVAFLETVSSVRVTRGSSATVTIDVAQ